MGFSFRLAIMHPSGLGARVPCARSTALAHRPADFLICPHGLAQTIVCDACENAVSPSHWIPFCGRLYRPADWRHINPRLLGRRLDDCRARSTPFTMSMSLFISCADIKLLWLPHRSVSCRVQDTVQVVDAQSELSSLSSPVHTDMTLRY